MVVVTVVSFVVAWNNEDHDDFVVELPMFEPLMWIAVGIFTGESTRFERLNRQSLRSY